MCYQAMNETYLMVHGFKGMNLSDYPLLSGSKNLLPEFPDKDDKNG
jgi:hypothetical protein